MSEKIKMLMLSLTGKCNFSCVYCYASEHDADMMTFQIAKKAIDMAWSSKEKFILQFSGGEPLLNIKCLKEAITYVYENRIPAIMQIQTNASLLTDDIAMFLRKYNCGIGISLDGRPNINDQFRKTKQGKGTANIIINGVEILRQNYIACGITCTVTNANVAELSSVVDMAYYLGNVKRIGFDILRGQGRGADVLAPEENELYAAVKKTYEKAVKYERITGNKIKFAQLERVQTLANGSAYTFGHCYSMNGEAAFVDAKGNIYACSSLIGNEQYKLGDVFNGICIEKKNIIAKTIKESMSFCFNCSDFSLCGGGCYARWLGNFKSTSSKAECSLKRVSIEYWCDRNKKK